MLNSVGPPKRWRCFQAGRGQKWGEDKAGTIYYSFAELIYFTPPPQVSCISQNRILMLTFLATY